MQETFEMSVIHEIKYALSGMNYLGIEWQNLAYLNFLLCIKYSPFVLIYLLSNGYT